MYHFIMLMSYVLQVRFRRLLLHVYSNGKECVLSEKIYAVNSRKIVVFNGCKPRQTLGENGK